MPDLFMREVLRWLRGFGPDRARGYSIVLLVGLLPVIGYYLFLGLTRSADFVSFWSAARMAWTDPALSYSWGAIRALQTWVPARDLYPFPNPPPFLLALAPFGLFPYQLAFCLFVLATLGLYLVATRGMGAFWPSLAFTAVTFNVVIGQNGLLTAALFIGAARLLDRKPALAGGLFGLLIIKPQLAVLVPIALLADRRWKAFIGAAASSLGALGLATIVLGLRTDRAFLDAFAEQRVFLFDRTLQLKMQTPFTLALTVGSGLGVAVVCQAVSVLIAAGTVVWVWRAEHATEAKCAVLTCAIPFATPYLYGYDLVLLFPAIVWLARREASLASERLVLGAAFLSPMLCTMIAVKAGVNVGPVINALLLTCVVRRARSRAQASVLTRPAIAPPAEAA